MVYVSLADMALHGRTVKGTGSLSPSLRWLYPSYGNFTPSLVLWGHPTAYDVFATLLSLLGIPQFTLICGHRRLSPVDSVTLCSMNRSPTPPQLPSLALYRSGYVAFHALNRVGLRGEFVSALNTIPTASLPTLYVRHCCRPHRVRCR